MTSTILKTHPPASLKEATAKIEEPAGVGFGETQVRRFLKNLGKRYRKIGEIPAGADLEKQEKSFEDEFKATTMTECEVFIVKIFRILEYRRNIIAFARPGFRWRL